ncbi:membrane protein, partial [Streptomyces coelicoflavus ZG0656]
ETGGPEEARKDAPGPEKAEDGKKDAGKKGDKETGDKETGKRPDPGSIPSSGPGTFATADGGGDRVGGSGRTLTYVVQVEDGIGIPVREVATEVERVLADERGWTADGRTGFRRVSGGASDFRVRLATAGTVDDICGQYGLDTGGEVNCNVGQDVMVNLKRWLLATQYYADDVTSYRALIINHEVGHFLGHGHEGCPGAGRPAPVMMQQIKGLHGCRTNVWPYDAEGRPITGPALG